jgi:protocatechuate 4,5-dioxygenase alpha chain
MQNWREPMPSPTAYAVDKVIFDVHHDPGAFEAFGRDRRAYLRPYELPEALVAAFEADDVGALYLAGANPYLLRAHCIAMRVPEKDFVASLRAAGDAARG